MPSKTNNVEEFCFPCRFHIQEMVRSGQHPLYRMYCGHPIEQGRFERRSRKGKLIGENNEHRPQWCPIRGDAQAEKDAER